MRLKEDKSSWHSSAIIKRDFRHDSSQPVGASHRTKKDTKKWCRGKVGVEHDYEYQIPPNDSFIYKMQPICLNCGKQDYHDVLWWCRHHEEWEEHPSWNHGQ